MLFIIRIFYIIYNQLISLINELGEIEQVDFIFGMKAAVYYKDLLKRTHFGLLINLPNKTVN